MFPGLRLKKWLFIAAGTGFVGIGVVGIAVPVLPTTPFLLLAAYFYARGSQRLHDALLNNRIVGMYLRNYTEGRGMTLHSKVVTLGFLWIGILLAATLATDAVAMQIGLVAVAVGVTIHIVTLKTADGGRPPSPTSGGT